MGDNQTPKGKSRRDFFSIFSSDKKKPAPVMVKMLTAEGKLVEVEKSVLDRLTDRTKASNKEIYDWMDNPSKENS